MKKKFIIFFLRGLLLMTSPLIALSNGAEKAQTWEAFQSAKGGFEVKFPVKPEHVKQSINIPNSKLVIHYDTFVSEPSDSVVYVVSVWNYPSEIDLSRPEVNLQDGFGGMLSALPGSKVLDMGMTPFDGHQSLKFLVQNDDIYFQGRLILVHNTLYQVFAVYRDKVDMEKNYQTFMDSFKLVSPESRQVPPMHNGHGKRLNV